MGEGGAWSFIGGQVQQKHFTRRYIFTLMHIDYYKPSANNYTYQLSRWVYGDTQ